jgi:hypothetical protein
MCSIVEMGTRLGMEAQREPHQLAIHDCCRSDQAPATLPHHLKCNAALERLATCVSAFRTHLRPDWPAAPHCPFVKVVLVKREAPAGERDACRRGNNANRPKALYDAYAHCSCTRERLAVLRGGMSFAPCRLRLIRMFASLLRLTRIDK